MKKYFIQVMYGTDESTTSTSDLHFSFETKDQVVKKLLDIQNVLLTKPSTASSEKCKRCGCNGEIHSGVCLTCHYELSYPTPPKKKIEPMNIYRHEHPELVDKINQLIERVNSLNNK